VEISQQGFHLLFDLETGGWGCLGIRARRITQAGRNAQKPGVGLGDGCRQ